VLGQATSDLGLTWLTTARTWRKPPPSPYNILCNSLRKLHPNGTFSRDSQRGVSKLSRVRLLGLWASMTSCSDLRLGWGLKQSCSSLWDLSNAMLHSYFRCWNRVDSQLLVVRSQTVSLTPGPSFAQNWAADVQMAHARPLWTSTLQDLFNSINNTPMQGVLTLAIKLWVFGSPGGLQVSTFGSLSFIFTLSPKWGCDSCSLDHVFTPKLK